MSARFSFRAVALGTAVSIGGSAVLGVVTSVVIGITADESLPRERAVADAVSTFLLWTLLVGLVLTFVGGFVAGRLAPAQKILHGALVGLIALVVRLVLAGAAPAWFKAASCILVVPIGAFGGFAADRKPR